MCAENFSPSANGVHAITINANDVDIDLGSFPLSMDPSSTTYDNYGIVVGNGVQNLRIHDGTIRGFSACGISGNANWDTLIVENLNIEGIPYASGGSRISTTFLTGGICLLCSSSAPCTNFEASNILVKDLSLTNSAPVNAEAIGGYLSYVTNVWIEHTWVTNTKTTHSVNQNTLTNADSIVLAWAFNTVTNILLRDSHMDNGYCVPYTDGPNVDTDPVNGDVYGFQFFEVSGQIEVTDCTVNNNVGNIRSGGFVFGFGTSNFMVERCQASNNTLLSYLNPNIQSHYGFEVVSVPIFSPPESPNNNIASQGTFTDCVVTSMPLGFTSSFLGSSIIFKDCIASGSAAGYSTNIGSIGFEAGGYSTNIIFDGCTATNFQGAGDTVDVSHAGNGAGFFVGGGTANITIKDCTSTQNNIGIQARPSALGLVARNNDLYFNSLIAIYDERTSQTPNLYIGNMAFGNGKIGSSQYAVVTANPNFIQYQTSQSASFPLIARPLTNYDLSP